MPFSYDIQLQFFKQNEVYENHNSKYTVMLQSFLCSNIAWKIETCMYTKIDFQKADCLVFYQSKDRVESFLQYQITIKGTNLS